MDSIFIYQNMVLQKLGGIEKPCEFDCGDDDLNDYFANDSVLYRREHLTESYCFYDYSIGSSVVVAYVDFCNDAISRENLGTAGRRKIRNEKRGYKTFPAVKITRLGVNRQLQKHGLGSLLLDTIKCFFISDNKAGCRFLTLDAYRGAIPFYERNRFRKMQTNGDMEQSAHTVPMFYDLKELLKN